MNATLHAGSICAHLDDGALWVIEAVTDGVAIAHPIGGGTLQRIHADDLWPLMDYMP